MDELGEEYYSEHQDDFEEPYETLRVPLVVCKSAGGPLDDHSFMAGTFFGATCSALENDEIWEGYVPTAVLPQIDLLAMGHQAALCVEDTDETGFWTYIELHPGGAEDEDDDLPILN